MIAKRAISRHNYNLVTRAWYLHRTADNLFIWICTYFGSITCHYPFMKIPNRKTLSSMSLYSLKPLIKYLVNYLSFLHFGIILSWYGSGDVWWSDINFDNFSTVEWQTRYLVQNNFASCYDTNTQLYYLYTYVSSVGTTTVTKSLRSIKQKTFSRTVITWI